MSGYSIPTPITSAASRPIKGPAVVFSALLLADALVLLALPVAVDELPDVTAVEPEAVLPAAEAVPVITAEAPEEVMVVEDCVARPPFVFVAVISTG